jgi:hypothetical protein
LSLYKKPTNRKYVLKIIALASIFVCLTTILYITNDKSGIVADIKEEFFSIEIIVTKNYGDSIILSKNVGAERGETAMDGLEKVSDVTHNYGGGFVESINGIKSTYSGGKGEKNDWFYFINGILSPIGASDYILHPGDIERWDFHYWGSNRMTTAIIADYPEPFAHGFHGRVKSTYIVYSDLLYDVAYDLQQSLNTSGVSASLKLFHELSDSQKSNSNLILLDTADNELIRELNNNAENIGWFIEFENEEIITFTEYGKKNLVFDHGSTIIATQNPWNPKGNWNGENVVWVVSGITVEDVKKSVELLVNNPKNIENSVSIVLVDGNIYKVP